MGHTPGGSIKLNAWLWLGPASFLVHDGEEILTIEPWLRAHRAELPSVVQPLAEITAQRFAGSVAVLFAVFVLTTWHGASAARRGLVPWPFLVVTGILVANSLTHLMQAAYFRAYTPGVLTALFVVLPYGIGVGHALVRSTLVSWPCVGWLVGLGLVLQVPVILVPLLAGRL